MKGYFSVSFPGTKKAGKKELKKFRTETFGYKYILKRNPDKKGYTIFARSK